MDQIPTQPTPNPVTPLSQPVKIALTAGAMIGASVAIGVLFSAGLTLVCLNLQYGGCGFGVLLGFMVWPIVGAVGSFILLLLIRGGFGLAHKAISTPALIGAVLMINILVVLGVAVVEYTNGKVAEKNIQPYRELQSQQANDLRLETAAATMSECDQIQGNELSWHTCINRLLKTDADYQECLRQARIKAFTSSQFNLQEACDATNTARINSSR